MNKLKKRSTKKASKQRRRSNWRGLRKLSGIVSFVHGKRTQITYTDEHGYVTKLGYDKVFVNLPNETKLEFIFKNSSKMVALEPNDVRSVAKIGTSGFVVKTYSGEKIYFSTKEEEENDDNEK